MTRLCPGPEDDRLRPGQVAVGVEARPGVTTVFVRGELDLVTLPALAGPLALIAEDKPGQLVFDLAGTQFMDCGSVRLIAGSGQWLRGGRRPVIRHPGPGVRRILVLTGLDACCDIEALAHE